jgi:hypothetical protein
MATVAATGKGCGDVGSSDVRAQSTSIRGRQALPVQTVPSGEPVSSLTARRGAEGKAAYGAPGDVVSRAYLSRWRGRCTIGCRWVDHSFYITLVDRSISRKLGTGLAVRYLSPVSPGTDESRLASLPERTGDPCDTGTVKAPLPTGLSPYEEPCKRQVRFASWRSPRQTWQLHRFTPSPPISE